MLVLLDKLIIVLQLLTKTIYLNQSWTQTEHTKTM